MIGTGSFVSVIANFVSPIAEETTKTFRSSCNAIIFAVN